MRMRAPEFWSRAERLLEATAREHVSEMVSRVVDGLRVRRINL
jgi:hypothetical protein